MTSFVYPPIQLSSVPVGINNPDGTQAQFNFAPIEAGQVVDLSTIVLGAPITLIAALAAELRKVEVKNDSGKNLLLTVGTRPAMLIGKGDSGDGVFDLYGAAGEAVTLTTEDSSTGSGEMEINFLG